MKPSFESPEVQALLVGVYRSSPQTYLRICPETGRHLITPIRRQLIELGMCSKTASLYLKQANLPIIPFVRNSETEAAPPAKPAKKSGPPPLTEEQRAEKTAAKDAVVNSKRFQFVETNTGKFGVWDGFSGTVLSLFHSRSEAISELIRLKAGKSYVIENN